jgi:hypothetical protein
MYQTNSWGSRRYWTLGAVLAVHAALFLLLLLAPSLRIINAPPPPSIQLLFLQPSPTPRVVSQNSPPPHLTAVVSIDLATPLLSSDSSVSTMTAQGLTSDSNGDGSGVDWAAEAHRAIRAFEIRSHQPSIEISVSNSPAEEQWWPRTRHRIGDRFKTPTGDWVVWISPNCYQVASAATRSNASDTTQPSTVCLPDPPH